MTLICISGELGEGKTLALTYLGLLNHVKKNREVYSNYKLNHIPYNYVESVEDLENVRSGVLLGDEFWFWIDCRTSLSKGNRVVRNIILKSRKRDFHIFYTSQRFGQMDVAVRAVTDFMIVPALSRYKSCPGFDEDVPTVCSMRWFAISRGSLSKVVKVMRFNPIPIFGMYDTNEEIAELES